MAEIKPLAPFPPLQGIRDFHRNEKLIRCGRCRHFTPLDWDPKEVTSPVMGFCLRYPPQLIVPVLGILNPPAMVGQMPFRSPPLVQAVNPQVHEMHHCGEFIPKKSDD